MLMHKLMTSRGIDPDSMGIPNSIPGQKGNLRDDDGQAIRATNFSSSGAINPTTGLTVEQQMAKQFGYPSQSILLSNMFDSKTVDPKDFNFFADIKE